MTVDWSPIDTALADLRRQNIALPLWWRDDDAIARSPQLSQLATLSEKLALPVHLAVIPKFADETLARAVAERPRSLIPIVHGWQHQSHAPKGAKNAEFGHPRDDGAAQLGQALAALQSLFGAQLLPMFVPPWNRITPDFYAPLAALGYSGLSTFTPRSARLAAPHLVQINTHIDPIFWKGSRSLVPPETLIAQTAQLLRDRAEGSTDADEPLGYLTHHLVHDSAIWAFSETLLARLLDGGAQPLDLRSCAENLP
ncbi:MAG: polysaccharide deacetylase family protein [Sulfitobacter sp.]